MIGSRRSGAIGTSPSAALGAGAVAGRRSGVVAGGSSSRQGNIAYGGAGLVAGRRSGSVSYGGGAVAAHGGGHRTGTVSYRHGSYGHVHRHPGGRYVAWWNPTYYHRYSSCWYGGLPAFGFGVAWYGSSYDPWFDSWGGGPVYVPQPYPVYPTYPVYPDPGYGAPMDPGYGAPVDPGYVPGPAPEAPPAPLAPEAGVLPPAPQGEPGTFPPPSAPGEQPAPPPAEAQGPMDEEARRAFQTSFQAFQEGRYEDAFTGLDAIVKADPNNGEAWMGRFYAAFALGRITEAAASLGEAGKLGAFPRGYRFDPRPIFKAQGERRFDDLLAALEQHAHATPKDAEAHLVLAYFLVALDRHGEAQAEIAWVRTLRPEDPLLADLETAMLPPEPPPTGQDDPVTPGTPGAPPPGAVAPGTVPPGALPPGTPGAR